MTPPPLLVSGDLSTPKLPTDTDVLLGSDVCYAQLTGLKLIAARQHTRQEELSEFIEILKRRLQYIMHS